MQIGTVVLGGGQVNVCVSSLLYICWRGISCQLHVVDEELDAVLGVHVFDVAGKHHAVGFANLPHNVDEGIVVHGSGGVKFLAFVVIGHHGVHKGLVCVFVHEFLVCVVIDKVILVGFQTNLFQKGKQRFRRHQLFENLIRHDGFCRK
jgi:hypothetical protein